MHSNRRAWSRPIGIGIALAMLLLLQTLPTAGAEDFTPPPDGRELNGKVAALGRAAEHLSAEYPKSFDPGGTLCRTLAELKVRTAALVSSGGDEATRRQINAELAKLSRRILLEQNRLMQFGRLLFTRRSLAGSKRPGPSTASPGPAGASTTPETPCW